MSRWMLATAVFVLAGLTADAQEKTSPKNAKVIRVLVLEDAQPAPAGPSATPPTPGVIVDMPASGCDSGASANGDKCKHRTPKHFNGSKREDCPGCGSLRYYGWFIFSSCSSFFGEGRYAPRYPDNCPACCPHH